MEAKALSDLFDELIEMQDDLAQDLVLTTIQEQLGGVTDVGISNDQLIDTLLCYRNGNCNCFHGMVNKICAALNEDPEDDEGEPETAIDPKFAEMMAKVATSRVQ